ncbi:MAG: right-handed parallel beta-helix repeat-containing protein, partial [Verrucomicrobiaceae bacterium]
SYTGVSVGWLWGYAESPGKRNTINLNHIHHIGDGLLSDLGAVYTLGLSQGTTVSGNHIHDVTALTYGGWGLYNDEGSTGILMENNVVTRTKNGSYHQHYGRENVLRNNILAFAELGQIQLTRAEEHLSFSLTGNIVLWRSGPALNGDGFKTGRVEMDRNLYWRTDGAPPDFAGMAFSVWQTTGHDRGSLVADPMFRDPVKGDWALDPASPALRMGFRPIDLSESGLYGDPAWIAKGRAAPDFRIRYSARSAVE